MSKKFWLLFASLSLALPNQMVMAQDAKSETKNEVSAKQDDQVKSLSDLMDDVTAKVEASQKKMSQDMQAIQKSEKDSDAQMKKMRARYDVYVKGMASLGSDLAAAIQKNPKTDAAKKAILFLTERQMDSDGELALLLVEHHSKGNGLMRMAFMNALRPSEGSKKVLAKILSSQADDDVKMAASLGVVTAAIAEADDTPETEAKLKKIVADYSKKAGDLKVMGMSLSGMAEGQLFEFLNLRIGKVAPDISAEDIDGVEFKLSDYRGQVVFLDFWGDW